MAKNIESLTFEVKHSTQCVDVMVVVELVWKTERIQKENSVRKRFKVTIFVESSRKTAERIAEHIKWHYPNLTDSYLIIPDDNIQVEEVKNGVGKTNKL